MQLNTESKSPIVVLNDDGSVLLSISHEGFIPTSCYGKNKGMWIIPLANAGYIIHDAHSAASDTAAAEEYKINKHTHKVFGIDREDSLFFYVVDGVYALNATYCDGKRDFSELNNAEMKINGYKLDSTNRFKSAQSDCTHIFKRKSGDTPLGSKEVVTILRKIQPLLVKDLDKHIIKKIIFSLTFKMFEMMEMIKEIKDDVSTLKGDVSALKGDVSALKGDVSTLKGDVSTLKGDVSTLKEDVSTLKNDMVIVKSDVATLKTDISALNTKVDQLRLNVRRSFESAASVLDS